MKSRQELIEEMAEQLTDETDLKTILQCFYSSQIDYFNSMSYEDLLSEAEQMNIDIDDVAETIEIT